MERIWDRYRRYHRGRRYRTRQSAVFRLPEPQGSRVIGPGNDL